VACVFHQYYWRASYDQSSSSPSYISDLNCPDREVIGAISVYTYTDFTYTSIYVLSMIVSFTAKSELDHLECKLGQDTTAETKMIFAEPGLAYYLFQIHQFI